jgi:hypothetical protein
MLPGGQTARVNPVKPDDERDDDRKRRNNKPLRASQVPVDLDLG